jgi:hypothetical protein
MQATGSTARSNVRAIDELLTRRRARRWRRRTEVEPEEDYVRRAGIGTAIAGAFFLLVIAVIVVGLVLSR